MSDLPVSNYRYYGKICPVNQTLIRGFRMGVKAAVRMMGQEINKEGRHREHSNRTLEAHGRRSRTVQPLVGHSESGAE
jgi:hypothetical protein